MTGRYEGWVIRVDQNKKIVAQRISQLLALKKMTQTQLAEKSGITQAAISQIVNEERFPTTPVLMKIAKVFTVSIDYLVGQTSTPDVASAIENDETLVKFFRNFQSLDPQMQELLKQQAELMKNQLKDRIKSLEEEALGSCAVRPSPVFVHSGGTPGGSGGADMVSCAPGKINSLYGGAGSGGFTDKYKETYE